MIEKVNTGSGQILAEMARMRASATAPLSHDIATASLSTPSFSSVLDQAINHVDRLQNSASEKQRAVDMGISDDLTGAMLESQKASVAFTAMVQVRNKLTSALDDVLNLSV
ncbi:flagellar hook-basal body complex protein FliE [Erwinia oleae]|uniref:flagellar hook-basal body complex protein FliE n=1 Tax=Erwinia oleae TaxID=796334 RepID=UPI000907D6FC|nr:flagellar hook-basal body complex protein FliE [Erwinia oleae]